MESSYLLKLSAAQQESLAQQPSVSAELLIAAIHDHAEQIGYMLQAYFPKEKVSRVAVVPGSVVIQEAGHATLQLEFVKEEYNACSAIDTVLKDRMRITLAFNRDAGVVNLTGENWPEL